MMFMAPPPPTSATITITTTYTNTSTTAAFTTGTQNTQIMFLLNFVHNNTRIHIIFLCSN